MNKLIDPFKNMIKSFQAPQKSPIEESKQSENLSYSSQYSNSPYKEQKFRGMPDQAMAYIESDHAQREYDSMMLNDVSRAAIRQESYSRSSYQQPQTEFKSSYQQKSKAVNERRERVYAPNPSSSQLPDRMYESKKKSMPSKRVIYQPKQKVISEKAQIQDKRNPQNHSSEEEPDLPQLQPQKSDTHIVPDQQLVQAAAVKKSWTAFIPNPSPLKLEYRDDDPLTRETAKTQGITPFTSDTDPDNIIKLSMRLKKKILTSSSQTEQRLPLLVSLAAEDLPDFNRLPIDLVCVIDHSGSMCGKKLQAVKKAFEYLVQFLDEKDRLCVISFNHTATRLTPLLSITQENKKRIREALEGIFAVGGTNIQLGMMHAFEVLKQRRYVNPLTSIFLLSDGLGENPEEQIKLNLERLKISENITINTFGFGRDHDPQQMVNIADIRDGNFYFIDKLETLDEAFLDCLGGLFSSTTLNIELKVIPEKSDILKGIKIAKAYGDKSMWEEKGEFYITKMKTLRKGSQRDFVLEVVIPRNPNFLQDHQKNIRIATAEAIITDYSLQQTVKKAEVYLTLLNDGENDFDEDDFEVVKHLCRVKGALAMQEARKLADDRKGENSVGVLGNLREQIVASFEGTNYGFTRHLLLDMKNAMEYVKAENYHEFGRLMLFNDSRALMHQRSNLTMANSNMNSYQQSLKHLLETFKDISI